MLPLRWTGCPWPIFETHIFLQNAAAKRSSESLLADNNNTGTLHHRCTQSLIPCQCNLQSLGLIYLFIFYFSPLLDHLLTNPLLPIAVREKKCNNSKQCTLPRGCCNADYSVCELIRSVSEYEVSRWIYLEFGFQMTTGDVWLKGLRGWFCSPWLSW